MAKTGCSRLTSLKKSLSAITKSHRQMSFFKNWKEKLQTDSVLTLKLRLGKNKKQTTLTLFWGLIKIKS